MKLPSLIAALPVVAIVACFNLAACAAVRPPTPAILRGAEAAGGWDSGGCPPRPEEMAFAKGPEARSVGVEQRLIAAFPAGTPEPILINRLSQQGFSMGSACENAPSIHRAYFRQTGGGFYGPFPISAALAWKVDGNDRIVWFKAFVAYTGP